MIYVIPGMQIKEIHLLTSHIEKPEIFYGQNLGLKISKKEKSVTIKTKLTEITFTESDEFENPFYHFAFNIPENKLSEAKEWISQKTDLISLDGEDEFDFSSWNAHSVYFYDPAGNIVELIARHSLKNQSNEKFSADGFLCISEIGLPVSDVKDFYEKIKSEFSIPVFSGDLKTFTAAGDDEGLFIIVPKGRRWFPDCPDAKIFPATVKISTDKNKTLELTELSYKIISVKN